MLNTNKGNFVCSVYCKAEVFQKLGAISIFKTKILTFKNVVTNFAVCLKVYIRELACRNWNLFERVGKLVVNLFAAGSLLSLRSVRREAENELAQVFHFFFCLLLLVVSLTLHNLSHLIPEIIVTAELGNLSIVNIADEGTYCVQKVSVVRYNNYSIFKIKKEVFQPGDRLNVKTVCRLIENEGIRISINSLCKKNANFLRLVQLAHHFVVVLFFKTKSAQHLLNLIFSFIAAKLTKLCFELGRFNSIFLGEISLSINLVAGLRNLIKTRKAHHNSVFYRIFIKGKVVLLQNSHTLARSHKNLTRILFELTGKQLQKSRFSGTICTCNTVTVSLIKLKIDILKKRLLTERNTNITNSYH